nr:conjugal transfer protein TraG N-terminal domain-containing protein [Methylococcus capsulatus]
MGDGAMLHAAFNSVAMLFNSGMVNGLAKIGFVIAILAVPYQYMSRGQFPLAHVLIALILYMGFFMGGDRKATVAVEDVYDGSVRVVANVPYGVAIPVSAVSRIGYELATAYETAFSAVQTDYVPLFDGGYVNSLHTLLKLRNLRTGTFNSDPYGNGDLYRTLRNYVGTCVSFMLDLPQLSGKREELMKTGDLLEGIKTLFINIDVMTYLPDPQQQSCADAYDAIAQVMDGPTFRQLLNSHAKSVLGLDKLTGDPEAAVDQALANLVGTASIDAMTYMRNQVIAAYLRDGPMAAILTPAEEQIQMEWASEQSIFMRIARPLMAFVESFVVGTAPFAGFLVAFGPAGLGMFFQYLKLILWTALWLPIMAVCNSYVQTAAAHAFQTLADNSLANGADPWSLSMSGKVTETLGWWVSTGGMLAASTPALSMMLVWGGGIAASHLTGRIQPGKLDTGALTPKAVQSAPAWQMESSYTVNPNVGGRLTGVQQNTVSVGSMYESAVSSARHNVDAASSRVSASMSQLVQTAAREANATGTVRTLADALTQSQSQRDQMAGRSAKQIAEQLAGNSSEKAAIENAASFGLGLGIKASVNAMGGVTEDRARILSAELDRSLTSERAKIDEWSRNHSEGTASETRSLSERSSVRQAAREYQSALERQRQASEQYQKLSSMSASLGESASLDINNLAYRLRHTDAARWLQQSAEDFKRREPRRYALYRDLAEADMGLAGGSGLVGVDHYNALSYYTMMHIDPAATAERVYEAIAPRGQLDADPGRNAHLDQPPGAVGLDPEHEALIKKALTDKGYGFPPGFGFDGGRLIYTPPPLPDPGKESGTPRAAAPAGAPSRASAPKPDGAGGDGMVPAPPSAPGFDQDFEAMKGRIENGSLMGAAAAKARENASGALAEAGQAAKEFAGGALEAFKWGGRKGKRSEE